jgi:hypothetical protein
MAKWRRLDGPPRRGAPSMKPDMAGFDPRSHRAARWLRPTDSVSRRRRGMATPARTVPCGGHRQIEAGTSVSGIIRCAQACCARSDVQANRRVFVRPAGSHRVLSHHLAHARQALSSPAAVRISASCYPARVDGTRAPRLQGRGLHEDLWRHGPIQDRPTGRFTLPILCSSADRGRLWWRGHNGGHPRRRPRSALRLQRGGDPAEASGTSRRSDRRGAPRAARWPAARSVEPSLSRAASNSTA